jgi:peptidoglycan/xylan/chitin deacetylase (PgdA/CDA1 family)
MGLKTLKVAVLQRSKRMGVLSAVGQSRWRTSRLLILGYHGVSQEDEHLWNPALYITADALRRRMELLVRNDCAVLSLSEAVSRLDTNDLPPRSVALTFDDGCYDFFAKAYPVIREFGFPVTVYQTSYYCSFNRPVFDIACSYVLWKGVRRTIEGRPFIGTSGPLDLGPAQARASACYRIRQAAHRSGMSAEDKDALVERLAAALEVDWGRIRAKRLLHLMKPEELRQLVKQGVDVQLHTHRHRMPNDRDLFRQEILDNRRFLEGIGQSCAHHFCYPSGVYAQRFLPWLAELDVQSATTCNPGLVSSKTRLLLLPRLMDSSALSDVEIEGWLHGVSHVLPRRPTRGASTFD